MAMASLPSSQALCKCKSRLTGHKTVCVHRMASHFTQTLLVPVVFLSALIELTSQKQTFAGERWDVA